MEFYSVTAKFGHVGREKYIQKTIGTIAKSAKEAASHVRRMPRMKHHLKDGIVMVQKISRTEYMKLKDKNESDPYFSVSNRQEQDRLCGNLSEEIITLSKNTKIHKTERKNLVKYKMKKFEILRNNAIYEIRNYQLLMA